MTNLEFKDKVIYILSQDKWGKMLFSKHHYAIELGKMGNKVFFINFDHSNRQLTESIGVHETEYEDVFVVNIKSPVSYFVYREKRTLYNFFIKPLIKKVVKNLKYPPDLIWSFDLYNSLPIKYFSTEVPKIFFPVDGPFSGQPLLAAEGADLIISVTNEILNGYTHLNTKKIFLNHGVAEEFINATVSQTINMPLRIGYSGCFVTSDIDHKTILYLVKKHTALQFEFFGEYDYNNSSIHLPQNIPVEIKAFVDELKTLPNVKLHGVVATAELAKALKQMDLLLVCYNNKKNQSQGTNSHKLLEYLGSGKVVVSSKMKTYINEYPGWLMMPGKDSDEDICLLFEKVLNDLKQYNSIDEQKKRVAFAEKFTYPNQIRKIEFMLNEINSQK